VSILDGLKTVDEILLEMELEGYDDWFVNNFISSAVTTIIGDAHLGKTHLAIDAVRSLITGEDFLGNEVNKTVDRAAFLCTDPRGQLTVARRVNEAGLDRRRVLAMPFYTPKDFGEWKEAVADLHRQHVDLIVVDNTTDLAEDANGPREVKSIIDGLRLWSDSGAAILNLHHRNKSAGHGYFGSTLWQKWTRAELEVTGNPRKSARRIKTTVNDGEPIDLTLNFNPKVSPAFTVVKAVAACEAEPHQHERDPKTLDENKKIKLWLAGHPGVPQREAARRATADLGFTVSQARISRVANMDFEAD
jgi:hypothetical protein